MGEITAGRLSDILRMSSTLDAFFASYYRLRPVNATFTGIHDHDHRLPDWSPRGLAAALDEMASLRADLAPVPTAPGDPIACDLALSDAFLEMQIAEMAGDHFQRGNPALWTGEAIFSLIGLMIRDFAPAAERVETLEERLHNIPSFLAAARDTLGAPTPPLWLARAQRECAAAALLLEAGIPAWADSAGLQTAGRTSLTSAVPEARRAFEEFLGLLDTVPQTERGGGCGASFYELVMTRGHWFSGDLAELLGNATASLAAERGKLADLLKESEYGGWDAIQDALAALHPTAEQYLDRFHLLWEECRATTGTHDLLTWPTFPLRYTPIPAWARSIAPELYFLFYRSPAPFDDTTPEYLVPPVDGLPPDRQDAVLRATNEYTIKTNHVVHHGAIGHHVQNYYGYQAASRIGQVAAVDCASRIGMFTGGSLAEGWACYATDLMEEVGFFTDLERLAHQQGRVRQLVRAVLDIQVHVNGLPLADAVTAFARDTGVTVPVAEREITRLSMFPGTAIMYWMGTTAIHRLRARLETRDGSAFTRSAFHDKFLSYGALPVHLIAQLMHGAPE